MKVLLTPSKKQEENVYIYLDYKSLNIYNNLYLFIINNLYNAYLLPYQ